MNNNAISPVFSDVQGILVVSCVLDLFSFGVEDFLEQALFLPRLPCAGTEGGCPQVAFQVFF